MQTSYIIENIAFNGIGCEGGVLILFGGIEVFSYIFFLLNIN